MGNEQSKYQYLFGAEFAASAVIYHIIFWKIYSYFDKVKHKSPKDCLNIATNTISTIHAVISCLTFYDFFKYKRWERPTIDEPRLAGHLWAIGCGYFIADLFAHFICFMAYNKKEIPRRWEIIFHHVMVLAWWFVCFWPKFIWFWAIFAIILGSEASTIFLNLQWFGKYFKRRKLTKISKILLIITWFFVRIPIVFWCVIWLIKYWKQINRDIPLRAIVLFTGSTFLMVPLQATWTFMIIWKLYRAVIKAEKTVKSPIYGTHGTSLSFVSR
eukprot:535030_1